MTKIPSTDSSAHLPESLQIVPLDAALGAAVEGMDLRQIDDAAYQIIHHALNENVLLIFRNQILSPKDLVNVARHFGTPVSSSKVHQCSLDVRSEPQFYDLPPEITVVSNVQENGQPVGALGDAEVTWHADHSFVASPTAMRMLFAVEVPSAMHGGNTFFLNGYAAFDALPEDLKRRVTGKTSKQDSTVDLVTLKPRPGNNLVDDIRHSPGASHPIISTHPETGCNSIFLGRRHRTYVNGLTIEESETLLNELWAHCTQPQFIYEHRWAVGDLVVWDNRCALHRRDAFDPASRRIMYAAQVEGHRPYEAPDSLSRPPHPRSGP